MIVAITGAVLIAFIVGHLLGNLQIFLGPDWINSYAEHLRELGPFLWVIRAFLLVNVLLHIFFTISLALENRRARPVSYKKKEHIKATFASRSMALSGLIVLAFILYHLAHFTVRVDRSALSPAQGGSAESLRCLLDDGLRVSELFRFRFLRRRNVSARPSSQPRHFEFFSIARVK